ncbi:hypothetical protein C8Q73DRAFT_794149 [Cubamyces lactineus]|nr:hypothetical protein C8Q73DRAFT_794149 [Cubamyces lactineus]
MSTTPGSYKRRPRNSLPKDLRKRRNALVKNGQFPDKETYEALLRDIQRYPGCEWYTPHEHSNWLTEKKRAWEKTRGLVETTSGLPSDDVPEQSATDDAPLLHTAPSIYAMESQQPQGQSQTSLNTTSAASADTEEPGTLLYLYPQVYQNEHGEEYCAYLPANAVDAETFAMPYIPGPLPTEASGVPFDASHVDVPGGTVTVMAYWSEQAHLHG